MPRAMAFARGGELTCWTSAGREGQSPSVQFQRGTDGGCIVVNIYLAHAVAKHEEARAVVRRGRRSGCHRRSRSGRRNHGAPGGIRQHQGWGKRCRITATHATLELLEA